MTIVRDDSQEREARIDGMFNEFRAAQSRREARRSDSTADSRPEDNARTTAHQVPAEYLSLYTYLERRPDSAVVLTFEQLEAVLGFALPTSARIEADWWGEAALQSLSHSCAWTETGRTAVPSLPARTVTFERR